MSVRICAEAGINHSGDLGLAKQLIRAAKDAGADLVKFQKRVVTKNYTPDELAAPRQTPYPDIKTNREWKERLEFSREQYEEIDAYCKQLGIAWTASVWDTDSVKFIADFSPPFLKVPSARLTDSFVLSACADTGLPVVMSVGMSTLEEIDRAVALLKSEDVELTLLSCTSTYPCRLDELNLRCIDTLRDRYDVPVGFSSHAVSPWPVVYACVLGAVMVEAHLTCDRTWYGTDQSASLEPPAFRKMVKEIRDLDVMLGDGRKVVYASEEPIKAKLRR